MYATLKQDATILTRFNLNEHTFISGSLFKVEVFDKDFVYLSNGGRLFVTSVVMFNKIFEPVENGETCLREKAPWGGLVDN